jgi:hypothetical protein
MSYVTYPDSQYPKTLGPYGTPGWQFAPVPGWGKNMDYSAAPDMVGVGGLGMYHNKTQNDLVLPQYAPTSHDLARGAIPSLQLERGGVEQRYILPQWAPTVSPGEPPAPPYSSILMANYLARYSPTNWSLKQGGSFPVGGCSGVGCGLGASTTPQYGLGEIAMAGAAGLLGGMLLTYFWLQK